MSSAFGNSASASDFSDDSRSSITYGFTDANVCGESASCVVYRMHLGGLRVAVKRLKPEYRNHPLYIAAYRKEFQIGQQLKHDALPIYRQLHEDTDELYIVMDYVDGISLNEFIRTDEGQEYFSSEDNVRRFLNDLLNVTAYLHRSGVIHCDLKPANIILRHSDRGMMLIDLDKAYSDTLERTHGGTANLSDPLAPNEHPTAEKDFRAIGRIVDEIAEPVPRFPRTKFKQFRIACDKDGITAERLQSLLNISSNKKWWIISAVCLLAVIAMVVIAILHQPDTASVSGTPVAAKDTVIVPVQQQPAAPTEPVSVETPTLHIDVDRNMQVFIQSADSAMTCLHYGTLANSEIQNLAFDLTTRYTSEYGNMVSNYKKEYSTVPGMDIELAVARASERSRALHLLQQFTQAASDTIQRRHPELYR